MAFAYIICVLVLVAVLYFLVLITGEIAVWARNQITRAFRSRIQSLPLAIEDR
jgi:hypothetical protein